MACDVSSVREGYIYEAPHMCQSLQHQAANCNSYENSLTLVRVRAMRKPVYSVILCPHLVQYTNQGIGMSDMGAHNAGRHVRTRRSNPDALDQRFGRTICTCCLRCFKQPVSPRGAQ